MAGLALAWRIQRRVIGALMIRELITRFGRENIGFLWIMVEPLLFAVFVGLLWRAMQGPEKHGISVIAFIATGYIPLVLFRSCVSRSILLFKANNGLMYHRQIKILDFVFVRVFVETIGHMMAYLLIGVVLMALGEFPVPADASYFLLGWALYVLFTFSVCLIVAPLSEMSDVLEKFLPVTVYLMIPLSGSFNMSSWMSTAVQNVLIYSPPANCMEMMRKGIFGSKVTPIYDPWNPVIVAMVCTMVGLILCRRVRRMMVVE